MPRGPRAPPLFAAARASAERVGQTRSQLGATRPGSEQVAIERWEMASCGAVEIGKVEFIVDHR
jgi:hypothetical protein